MRISTQNLTDGKQSLFAHGRAWIWRKANSTSYWAHAEWLTFSKARDFALTTNFGSGDGDDGILIHLCIPFLFSLYLGIEGVCRIKKECHTGIAIHNQAFWLYPLPFTMESNSKDPWWRKTYCWNFPWQLDWYSTEVLEHKCNIPGYAKAVWSEKRGDKKISCGGLGADSFAAMRSRESAEATVTEDYEYTYIRNNGEVQKRRAFVHVNRMTWRARWWPLFHIQKVSTSIDVRFDAGVGEGAGSWKGGCTGCGYEMKSGEGPLETLRRMESERKFSR